MYWCWWFPTGEIYRARVVIANDTNTESERRRLIQLYLVRILGFRGATDSDQESIMASDQVVDEEDYSALDKALIQLLYHPEIQAGMPGWVAETYLAEP